MDLWLSKEPNNGNGNEDCVVMDVHDGKWNDVPCDKKHFLFVNGREWYFVTEIVMTYCEKKLF